MSVRRSDIVTGRPTDMAQILGTDGADTLQGTDGADLIVAGPGNDVVHAGGGDDEVDGHLGNDVLYGDDGNDKIYGEVGDDILFGGAGNDWLYGSFEVPLDWSGPDRQLPPGYHQLSYLYGGAGNDTLVGENTGNLVYGVPTNGTRTTYMIGGIGDDTYYARYADQDTIIENAGEGYDRIILMFRELEGGSTVFYMPPNIEEVDGALGTRRVSPGSQERIPGTIVGNELDNTIFTSIELGGVRTPTGNMTLLGGAGNDYLESDNGNDVLYGESGNDSMSGGLGIDVLIGGEGDDRLDTSYYFYDAPSADALYGGTGNDTYGIDHAGDIAFENPGEGNDLALVRMQSGGWYAHDNIESVWVTVIADVFVVGNGLNNDIRGNGGNELLLGGAGNDSVSGGGGNDTLFGEDGDDSLSGEAGVDYIAGGAGKDILIGGDGADALYGEDGDDSLNGGIDFATDILVGGAGNDSLNGDSGKGDYDLMDGGAGDDRYYVDTPDDLTFEAAGGGIDTVYANVKGAGVYLYANVEKLVLYGETSFGVGNELDNEIDATGALATSNPSLLGGDGNDVLRGNAGANGMYGEKGNDTLYAGRGDDVLVGGDGDDVLYGELGNDVSVGGAGKDHFYAGNFNGSTAPETDLILDFEHGIDRISLPSFFTSFAELKSHFTQQGTDTVIEYGAGRYLVLSNIDMTILTGADFGYPASTDGIAGFEAAEHVAILAPVAEYALL